MKKTLLLLAMLPFVFMACEKEEKQDDTQNLPNELIIRDTTYNLKEAFINTPYTYRGKTYYSFYFSGDGIRLDSTNKYHKFEGNGKFFDVSLELPEGADFPTGNLPDSTLDYLASYNIVDGRWNTIEDEWKTKTLTRVSKNGQTYEINFELKDSSDKKTTIRYKGALIPCNLGK